MSFLYNIIQFVSLIFLIPLIALMALFSAKYKERIPQRLGVGLNVPGKKKGRPRIWVHALSVGEAISAKPLIKALRHEMPECELFFSSVTQGGQLVAKGMSEEVDQFIPFPFDFFFTVKRFVTCVQPDIFVLVETDFWPNIIWQLEKSGVPCFLVNGRIAQRSFQGYYFVKPLFAAFFNSFAALSMQMDSGVSQLRQLDVSPQKISSFGNLKFDLKLCVEDAPYLSEMTDYFRGKIVLVAGSTHEGEEKLILDSFVRLSKIHTNLLLVIAPRDIERAQSLLGLAKDMNLNVSLRSGSISAQTQVVILNSLGELVYLYHFADISFVGGSFVDERGHNPLEPAYWGKPVVYGPYMEDFFEASQGLIEVGAAKQVTYDDFTKTIGQLCENPKLRERMGSSAADFVKKHQGAAKKCALLTKKLLKTHVS